MSDGREERKEEEERRKWKEKEDRDDGLDRDRERDWERERRDSRAADRAVKAESATRARRSFLAAAVAAAGGYGFYRWIDRSPGDQLLREPLRKALDFNAKVSRAVFDDRGLAPTYAVEKSVELRMNGNYGLKENLTPESYRLQVVGVENSKRFAQYVDDVTAWEYKYAAKKEAGPEQHDTKVAPKAMMGPSPEEMPAVTKMSPAFEAAFAALRKAQGNKRPRGQEEAGKSDNTLDPGTSGLLLTMEDVTRLPHHELVTEFKCIEGWSQIVRWGGVRMRDFMVAYPPQKNADGSVPRYVYMETPDGDYYCGYDMRVCEHPQSLLVTEMAGRPLTQWHGAPLRLSMPIKYGYKQIKRIGLIAYTDMKPDDYWTKLGYDWYAGL
jgi:DMSO/TMAO reductase YedYZ molybdopterin-dependent catalytic subunit